MQLKLKPIPYLLSILIMVVGCTYDFPVSEEGSKENLGNLDPKGVYILGSSISAGLMDGALYTSGQNQSYGPLLLSSINIDSEGDVNSGLLMNSEYGFNNEIVQEEEVLGKFLLSFRSPRSDWPQRITTDGEELSDYAGNLSTIKNFSIPDVKSFQFDDFDALSENNYFNRIQGIMQGQSFLDLIISRAPSVVILEPGTYDLFNYAINGGEGEVNPGSQSIGELDLTPTQVFENSLDQMVTRLLGETRADIFLINIPNPFLFPYFKTLPWYFTPNEWILLSQNNVPAIGSYDQFNTRVQEYNRTVDFSERRSLIVFDSNGGALFRSKVIEDEYLPYAEDNQGQEIPKWRQMTQSDYFLYNAENIHTESLNNFNELTFGALVPIEDKYIISDEEVDLIGEKRALYNSTLADIANRESRVHLIDFEGMITDILGRRLTYDGVSYSMNFDKKGIISADGYTLNPRGHALLANEIIKLMNVVYNADINLIDVNDKTGTNIGIQF